MKATSERGVSNPWVIGHEEEIGEMMSYSETEIPKGSDSHPREFLGRTGTDQVRLFSNSAPCSY